jgi:rhamnosyltransferase subunit B
MHYVLTTFGSAGDVFPMVGLGAALKARGHRVTLMTNDYFAPVARSHQLEFIPLGTTEEYFSAISSPDLWKPHKAFRYIYSYFKPYLKKQHAILAELSSQEPIVCLASCLCFGARMFQETHQVPVVTVHLQPAVIWSNIEPPVFGSEVGPKWLKNLLFKLLVRWVVDPIVSPHLNDWRREYNLPPMKMLFNWWNSPTGVLCLFPDWYAPPQVDWPSPLVQTDFPLWNDGSSQPLSEDLLRFLDAGTPPIVFTPGTANVHGQKFFQAAREACESLGRRGLFLTKHPEQLPASLPDSIRHFPYVPLDRLLPRAAAFVHHGGVGSTSQGLLAGVPQLIMPLAHDQFDNAARVRRLGVGDSLPEAKFTARKLIPKLKALLESADVSAACQKVRERMRPCNGIAQTVDVLESRWGKTGNVEGESVRSHANDIS